MNKTPQLLSMIYTIIEDLRSTASTNDKIAILKKNKDSVLLQKVLFYTYNRLINYYTRHQVSVMQSIMDPMMVLDDVFPELDKLIAREVTGNAATDLLNRVAAELTHPSDRMVLNCIVARDIAAGISAKTINKVWPNLIPTVPYMRCSTFSDVGRITYPAIAQRKADGLFCNAVIKDRKVKFFTRNGTEFSLDKIGGVLEKFAKYVDPNNEGVVLNGELLVTDDDGYEISRKEGNGLINSLIKKDATIESLREKGKDAKTLRSVAKIQHEIESKLVEYDNTNVSLKYVVWDEIDYNAWVKGEMNLSYATRLAHLKVAMENMEPLGCFTLIETKEVNSLEEAQEFYKEQIEQGYEGAILKNKNGIWKNHTSKDQIKLKAEADCDLRVVGYEPGTGKYFGGIGSLICESSCGRLRVSVGSGLSDRERGFERQDASDSAKGLSLISGFDASCYVGSIITVKYNEVIDSESKSTKSLFLPRVEELNRTDKTEADSLEKIMEG